MITNLRIYRDLDITDLLLSTEDPIKIQAQLQQIGVQFEQWPLRTQHIDSESLTDEAVINCYQQEIDQLIQSDGYQSYDLIRLNSSHPDKSNLRRKFLSEHTHSEDEVRFFVDGEGLFTIHLDGKVYEMHCVAGDLIRVPAHTKHWFDMGPNPNFAALRFFNNPDGWIAQFTGNSIADRFNRLEN